MMAPILQLAVFVLISLTTALFTGDDQNVAPLVLPRQAVPSPSPRPNEPLFTIQTQTSLSAAEPLLTIQTQTSLSPAITPAPTGASYFTLTVTFTYITLYYTYVPAYDLIGSGVDTLTTSTTLAVLATDEAQASDILKSLTASSNLQGPKQVETTLRGTAPCWYRQGTAASSLCRRTSAAGAATSTAASTTVPGNGTVTSSSTSGSSAATTTALVTNAAGARGFAGTGGWELGALAAVAVAVAGLVVL